VRNKVVDRVYDYDAIIYIASFPTPRINAWRTLSAARAIENESFVIAVNRTGDDIYCNYNGGSVVWDSFGEVVAECGDKECVVVAELDTDELKSRRKRFPTLRDADLFNIE
jgi:predicted amidohydrolase